MPFSNPAVRRAYVAGAEDAVESVYLELSAPACRALEQWLLDLAGWTGGEPPLPPSGWPLR